MLHIFLLLLLISSLSAKLCPPVIQPTARKGYKLTGHHITTYSYLGDREVCIEACAAYGGCCKSVNFYLTKKECELNRASHISNPENMIAAMDSEYIDYPPHFVCNTALGMEDKRIKDHQIFASSTRGSLNRAFTARLNFERYAWVAYELDTNQWLQVDFFHKVHVCAIATQHYLDSWVKTYSLQYSVDGVVFTDYKQGHIFHGNTVRGIVKNFVIPTIVAGYIRVLPKSWEYQIAMRIELYGYEA